MEKLLTVHHIIRPGSGFEFLSVLTENDIVEKEMENQIYFNFGENWGNKSSQSVCIVS